LIRGEAGAWVPPQAVKRIKERFFMGSDDGILKAAKEITIKFIEVGRLSPTAFGDTFKSIYTAIKEAVEGEPEGQPEGQAEEK